MSNYYVVDTAGVQTLIKNPYLLKLLKQKGNDRKKVIGCIRDNDGSLQDLTRLSPYDKEVFDTCREINQWKILPQASTREKYIDDGQSINLGINYEDFTAEERCELYFFSCSNRIKSLYYQLGTNASHQVNLSKNCSYWEA
ncbi:hypothetical protein [Staphylococcus phage vB_SauH_DELF3]|nr:hypothetical protein [Staphylococcus phage vB_SauH_DELF3]